MDLAIHAKDFPLNRTFSVQARDDHYGILNGRHNNNQALRLRAKLVDESRTAVVRGSQGRYGIYHSPETGQDYRRIATIELEDGLCPPHVKYAELQMWIDEERHEDVRGYLGDECGLIPLQGSQNDGLVWRHCGKEVYSVDFFGKDIPNPDDRGTVLFKYWRKSITEEIADLDPMRDAARKVYHEFNPSWMIIKNTLTLFNAP